MAQLLVRNLDEQLVQRLKHMAKTHHRSLQGEVKSILEGITKLPEKQLLALIATEPSSIPTKTPKSWPPGFLDEFFGCMADAPIERGPQGTYENREEFK